MYKKFYLALMCFTIIHSFSTYAQRGYVERAIEKSYEKKYGDPGRDKGNDWINNKLLNANVQPKYAFTKSITMHLTSYKNGSVKSESNMKYYFMAKDPIVGIEMNESNNTTGNTSKKKKKDDDMFTIYDSKANVMVMLNRAEKTGIAISMNAFMSKENIEKREKGESSARGKSSTDCKRTGKTKNIRGVVCEEWICVDLERETKSEYWINTKASPMAGQAQMKAPFGRVLAGGNVQGLIMEGNFYKNNELESKLETTDVNNADNYTIVSSEYAINK